MTFDVKEYYEQKRGALIKTETQEFYNIEGLRVYAKLDIYEGYECSSNISWIVLHCSPED